MKHVDLLLQKLGDRDSDSIERAEYRQLLQRWRRGRNGNAAVTAPRLHQRALIIDDRIPKIDRDAGSIVILSHMQSLQRLVTTLPSRLALISGLTNKTLQHCIGSASLCTVGHITVRSKRY